MNRANQAKSVGGRFRYQSGDTEDLVCTKGRLRTDTEQEFNNTSDVRFDLTAVWLHYAERQDATEKDEILFRTHLRYSQSESQERIPKCSLASASFSPIDGANKMD